MLFKRKKDFFAFFVVLVSVFGCFFASEIFAATTTYEGVPTAAEVLVVYNSSYTTDSNTNGTQDSLEIAQYYQAARSIPGANVLGISAPTTEIITRTQYNEQIKANIESYLTSSGLKTTIKYIVLIKGIPLKIQTTNCFTDEGANCYGSIDHSSVDAAVCLLYETYSTVWRLSNPYYDVDATNIKAYRFKTETFSTSGVYLRYLTTRLDGYTVTDIKAMIDKAVAPDTSGAGYWVIDDHLLSWDRMSYAYTGLKALSQNINPDPWSDTTSYITTNPSGSAIGYVSHGIHADMGDGYVSNNPVNANHLDFTLLNGAIFSSYESYNGYGFSTNTDSSHGQVAEWIQIGGSGGIGNIWEPWASSIANEDIFMPLYAIGYPWADAAYQSLAYMDFVSIVVGDPLMTIREVTPPAEVSNLVATPDDTFVSLTWTNPVDADFAGVKILRKTGAYPTLDNGTLAYNGTSTSYIDTGLTNGTDYYYTAFAYDEVPNYSAGSSSGARATSTPAAIPDTTPPGNVSAMSLIPGLNQIYLSWTNPADVDFAGVKILRKTTDFPTNSSDGTVVFSGNANYFYNSGLTPGTDYYYTAFAYDEAPNYSAAVSGAQASSTPNAPSPLPTEPDSTLPGKPSDFLATAGNGQIALSWTNASDSDFKGVKILRRTDYYPISSTNGALVYQGSGTSYTNTGLTNGITYFYTIFSYDKVKNFSIIDSTVKAKATPYSGSPIDDATPGSADSTAFKEPDINGLSDVADMTSVITAGQIALTWADPFNDNDWAGTVVLRKTGSYPQSPTDGIIIYDGQLSNYNDVNVSAGTTYYYAGFAYDNSRNYSDGTVVGAKTSALAQ